MKRIALLSIVLVGGFLAARIGWPWLILVATVSVAALSYLLIRDTALGQQLTLVVTLFVSETLIIGWYTYKFLHAVAAELPEEGLPSQAVRFLAGTSLLQGFWATLLGGLVGFLLVALVAGALAMARVPLMASSTQQPAQSVFWRALRRTLGLTPAEWAVSNGELHTVRAVRPGHPANTGPGEVEIQHGHVVVLEQNGKATRVLGPGINRIGYGERISMCPPLYGRSELVTLEHVTTQDGLIIQSLEINVFHRIDPDADKLATGSDNGSGDNHSDRKYDTQKADPSERFSYSENVIREKIWTPSAGDWNGAVISITRREARNLIANDTLENFLTANTAGRKTFKKKLAKAINKVTKGMGINVIVTGLGAVQLPAPASDKLTEGWMAKKGAQIEADIAVGRRDSFKTMMDALNSGVSLQANAKDLLVMSMIEQMERINGQSGQPSSDLDMVNRAYLLQMLKNLVDGQSPNGQPAGNPTFQRSGPDSTNQGDTRADGPA